MFPSQTFQPSDLAGVGVLIVLEALLSADNALVLAIMVRHLPRKDQQKALLYGLGGAFVFRLIAILFASIVLKQWWLQGLGAIYLLYLPIKHFITRSKDAEVKPIGLSFWRTVVAVEMTDIAFALDSVLAGIGFISRPGKGIQTDKIWVVYIGAVLGIILLRFAASMFIRLLERFPILDHVAYVLVGWVGVKLIFHAGSKYQEVYPNSLPFHIWHLPESVFWIGLGLIAIGGGFLAYIKQRPDETTWDDEAQVVGEAQDWRITEEESSRTQ